MVVLEDAGDSGRHQSLAQANHVADQHAVAFVQMVGGNLDGGNLEIEELLAEVAGNAELGQTEAGLLGKVVGPSSGRCGTAERAAPVPSYPG